MSRYRRKVCGRDGCFFIWRKGSSICPSFCLGSRSADRRTALTHSPVEAMPPVLAIAQGAGCSRLAIVSWFASSQTLAAWMGILLALEFLLQARAAGRKAKSDGGRRRAGSQTWLNRWTTAPGWYWCVQELSSACKERRNSLVVLRTVRIGMYYFLFVDGAETLREVPGMD
ncbi:hypothetical protein LZ30DRAFT_735243 [Colletotrichum cereale]|nr:hypothetical protein LZ30DRAFT_735243 [Colletotrichum cereale]